MRLWRACDAKALRTFYHLPTKLSEQAQYLSLANPVLENTSACDNNNWVIADQSDKAWRFMAWQGQDQQGQLRCWPYESGVLQNV
jgi:hypothetical protein